MKFLPAAGILILLLSACVPQEVKEGEKLYLQHCASCHGQGGWGTSSGPPLHPQSRKALIQQVRQPQGQMPPFPPEVLAEDELKKITGYLLWLHQTQHPH